MIDTHFFNLLSVTGLMATLLLFLLLTMKVAEQKHKVTSSLKFQMSLVIGIWLISELHEIISVTEAMEIVLELLHSASMMLFAVFMTWRTVKFLR